MKALICLALCAPILAQSVNLKKAPCPGDPAKPRVVLYVPATVAGAEVSVAACIDLGQDFRVVPSGTGEGLRLEMVPRQQSAAPMLRMETIKVPVDAGVALSVTLAATPVLGSPIMVFSRFNRGPSIAAATAANGRTLNITLPDGPFSPNAGEDVITVVYQAQAQ